MPLKRPVLSIQGIIKICTLMIFISVAGISFTRAAEYPDLSEAQKTWLGQQIFNNECNRRLECLTAWNPGEDFPSLGIGHFIWYRENQLGIFEESFPALLTFFESENISIPAWIQAAGHEAPWQDRNEFLLAFSDSELAELRTFLATTMTAQTTFIIIRFEAALEKILAAIPEEKGHEIAEKFYAVANSNPPYGLYALIDYVNFKGEGVAIEERYQHQGWGLLQVLENMPVNEADIMTDFVASAKRVLQNRVQNAPVERNETRWLQGWFNRLDSYIPTSPEALQNDQVPVRTSTDQYDISTPAP